MEPGLYVTFFSEGESFDRELPPVGPLEHVVVRDGSLMADRRDGERPDFDGGGRRIEAEYEFQRAIGKEPGGATKPDLRIVAPQGVYLRFVAFDSAAEHDPVPELGPYAVVVVGKHSVDADGDRLASRNGNRQSLWELTAVGGTALVGVIRPDIAFRTRSTGYHPEIRPFRPAKHGVAPAHTPKPHSPASHEPSGDAPKAETKPHPPATHARDAHSPNHPPKHDPPRAHQPSAHASARRPAPTPLESGPAKTYAPAPPSAETATLRDRIQSDQTRRDQVVGPSRSEGREWAGALWRLRFAVIAALLVMIVAFSVPSIRTLFGGGTSGTSFSTVGFGTSVSSADWTYSLGSVRRIAKIGNAQARGIFILVQVTATNRKEAGARLLPSNFALAAANGEQYAASGTTSNVYSGDQNTTSSYSWPIEFPPGRSVILPVIFEVDASLTGLQLVLLDVPATRMRLE